MFRVSDLNDKYDYDFSLRRSGKRISSQRLNKRDPFQVTAFINQIRMANDWQYNWITFYNCKRLEFLLQEKLPRHIKNKKEVQNWLSRKWVQFQYAGSYNIALN